MRYCVLNINDEVVTILSQTMIDCAKKVSKHIQADVTQFGIITDVKGDGLYAIKMRGQEYVTPCAIPREFTVGDRVLVLWMQGDINKRYIIGSAIQTNATTMGGE